MKNFVLLICLLAGVLGCSEKEHEGIYKQGRIDYKITYLNAENGSFDPSLLPKKMVLEFNEKFCTNTIDGFMGFFRLGNFTYFGKKKSTTFLKVLDKNYVFYGERQELMCCFDTFEDMTIVTDTTTKYIAGLKSYRAKATIPSTGDVFEIFYTNDINLDHPNITNPYLDLDGVLTDFVLFMGPYKMRFEAQKFDPSVMPKEMGSVPKDASTVTRDEMVYALDRLMSK
jgi:hypothetical protein